MTHDPNSLTALQYAEHFRLQRDAAERRHAHQVAPNIEMVVGPWHLDEFGNQTREITARD